MRASQQARERAVPTPLSMDVLASENDRLSPCKPYLGISFPTFEGTKNDSFAKYRGIGKDDVKEEEKERPILSCRVNPVLFRREGEGEGGTLQLRERSFISRYVNHMTGVLRFARRERPKEKIGRQIRQRWVCVKRRVAGGGGAREREEWKREQKGRFAYLANGIIDAT